MAVHEESADIILPEVLSKAVINGDNIVLTIVGRSLVRLRERVRLLTAAGYDVHLLLNDLESEEAARRAIERWRLTGRFIDPDYILNEVADRPRKNYNTLREEGGLASYAKYIADQPKGNPPRLIERTERSPKLWDD